jgi:hypothetical protein
MGCPSLNCERLVCQRGDRIQPLDLFPTDSNTVFECVNILIARLNPLNFGCQKIQGASARVLCSGKTLAFQANDRGSIPLTRFIL